MLIGKTKVSAREFFRKLSISTVILRRSFATSKKFIDARVESIGAWLAFSLCSHDSLSCLLTFLVRLFAACSDKHASPGKLISLWISKRHELNFTHFQRNINISFSGSNYCFMCSKEKQDKWYQISVSHHPTRLNSHLLPCSVTFAPANAPIC